MGANHTEQIHYIAKSMAQYLGVQAAWGQLRLTGGHCPVLIQYPADILLSQLMFYCADHWPARGFSHIL